MDTITIDCGASFLKGAVVRNGNIKRKVQIKSPKVHGEESIQKSVQILALIPLIRQMIVDLAGSEREVKLCIANEMHGFLLANQDGTPYTDYISWQKEYGAVKVEGSTALDELRNKGAKEDFIHTGMSLRAGLPISNLLYLRKKKYFGEGKRKLYFYTLGDYILKTISQKEPDCHPTNAAATGLYDLCKGTWNRNLIRAAAGKEIIFPKIGTEVLVFSIGSLKVNALPAVGDQQAALLGAGLKDEKTVSFNIGTGAQVSKIMPEPIFSDKYQIRPYFYGQYLKTVPHIPSGRALNVYIRFLKDVLHRFHVNAAEDEIWQILLKAEEEGEETNLTCDLSFYENALTEYKEGGIFGIGEYSLTLGNLMHSVLRQMAENFIWAAEVIEEDGPEISQVIFSGGMACKIEKLRASILKHYYKGIETKISTDETFLGLYLYGKQEKGING